MVAILNLTARCRSISYIVSHVKAIKSSLSKLVAIHYGFSFNNVKDCTSLNLASLFYFDDFLCTPLFFLLSLSNDHNIKYDIYQKFSLVQKITPTFRKHVNPSCELLVAGLRLALVAAVKFSSERVHF